MDVGIRPNARILAALAVAVFAACCAATAAAAPIDYDESVDGQLPRAFAPGLHTPGSALGLGAGTNLITGTSQWGGTVSSTFDTALLKLEDGLQIDSIALSAAKVDGDAILDLIRVELFSYDATVTSVASIRFERPAMPFAATEFFVSDLPIDEAGFYGVAIAGYSGNTNNSFAFVDYTWNIAVVPEPGTGTLLAVGLVGFSLQRRPRGVADFSG